jgi:hypothetical protein
MAFMQQQVARKMDWYNLSSTNGDWLIPVEDAEDYLSEMYGNDAEEDSDE